ncbi:hypothetical protein [Bacillus amyloliquefaciens]
MGDTITSLVSGFLGLSWNYKFKANIFSDFFKKSTAQLLPKIHEKRRK